MKLLITGATGLIGAEVVRQAITDDTIDEIIVLVRSQPEITNSKITVVRHNDFSDYTGLEEYFKKADALIWCLGISQTQVNRKQYEVITYEYTLACARFCLIANPSIRFVFVSGDGADRSEKSRTLFKKIKGKAENGLLSSGLKNLVIARPDAVRPRHKNKRAPFAYKLVYPLFPLVEIMAPSKVIWSDVLARALIKIGNQGYEKNTLENMELRVLGKS
ncbi:MAG TPA: NAD(P)H-binding protein [Chitinophagaceae bacterium]|nr:NAD(P)H-binding protein [Chitinophagaceae bacterium]